MRNLIDLAVILKRDNFGEADSIITVFSKNNGKLRILAKGSRKIKSKFVGHLEPFSLVKISLVSGRSFEILTSCEIKKSFYSLKENLNNLPRLNYIFEITNNLTCEELKNPQVFKLITNTLSSGLWKSNPDFLVLFFLINFLKLLGFSPHFDFCLKCNSKDLEAAYFSYYWGGILCEDCKDSQSKRKVDINIIRVLRILQFTKHRSFNIDKVGEELSKIDSDLQKRAFNIISGFLIFINEKKPNSLKFLESPI